MVNSLSVLLELTETPTFKYDSFTSLQHLNASLNMSDFLIVFSTLLTMQMNHVR